MISPVPEKSEDRGQILEKPLASAGTPGTWRLGIGAVILLVGLTAYGLRDFIGLRGQSVAGVLFFFGLVAMFSTNLRGVNWRTIAWGFGLQLVLAVLVLKVPAFYWIFERAGEVVKAFIGFSDEGAKFVFG